MPVAHNTFEDRAPAYSRGIASVASLTMDSLPVHVHVPVPVAAAAAVHVPASIDQSAAASAAFLTPSVLGRFLRAHCPRNGISDKDKSDTWQV